MRQLPPARAWIRRGWTDRSRTPLMTERIYYNDPYARTFDAHVREVRTVNGRSAVTLDRTAFYPTSGGQPFDTGTLNMIRVVEVVEDEDGEMVHVIEGALSAGEPVNGAIDW